MSTGLLFCPDPVQGKASAHGYASPGVCDRGEGGAIAPAIAAPSPSLSPIETTQPVSGESPLEKWQQETQATKKRVWAFRLGATYFSERHPSTHLAAMAFTFEDDVFSAKEAQRRWNSLQGHKLKGRYLEWIAVFGRQDRRGVWHYHLLIAMPCDIWTGFDFQAVARKDYRSVCQYLLGEWAFWRKYAHSTTKNGKRSSYGFGRFELLPVRTRGAALVDYMIGYMGEHLRVRKLEDKGVRLVRSSKGAMRVNTRCTRRTPGHYVFRMKLGMLCAQLGLTDANYEATFRAWYGKRWAYRVGPVVRSIHLGLYPDLFSLLRDYPALARGHNGEDSFEHLHQEKTEFWAEGWRAPDYKEVALTLFAAAEFARSERVRCEYKQKGGSYGLR